MSDTTGRDSDKFMLRLPDGMRERIKDAADRSKRSMNAEIVAALEIRFPPPPPLKLIAMNVEALSTMAIKSKNAADLTALSAALDELSDHFQREEPGTFHDALVELGRRRDDDPRGPRPAIEKLIVQRATVQKPKS